MIQWDTLMRKTPLQRLCKKTPMYKDLNRFENNRKEMMFEYRHPNFMSKAYPSENYDEM